MPQISISFWHRCVSSLCRSSDKVTPTSTTDSLHFPWCLQPRDRTFYHVPGRSELDIGARKSVDFFDAQLSFCVDHRYKCRHSTELWVDFGQNPQWNPRRHIETCCTAPVRLIWELRSLWEPELHTDFRHLSSHSGRKTTPTQSKNGSV